MLLQMPTISKKQHQELFCFTWEYPELKIMIRHRSLSNLIKHMVKQSQFGWIDFLYIFNGGSLTLYIKGELHSKILYVYLKNKSCMLIFKATQCLIVEL